MCHTLRARISKSEAARIAGVSRRTLIRHASQGLISEDKRGRVLLSEVASALVSDSSQGARLACRARVHRVIVLEGKETTAYKVAKAALAGIGSIPAGRVFMVARELFEAYLRDPAGVVEQARFCAGNEAFARSQGWR